MPLDPHTPFWDDVTADLRALPNDEAREAFLEALLDEAREAFLMRYNERPPSSLRSCLELPDSQWPKNLNYQPGCELCGRLMSIAEIVAGENWCDTCMDGERLGLDPDGAIARLQSLPDYVQAPGWGPDLDYAQAPRWSPDLDY